MGKKGEKLKDGDRERKTQRGRESTSYGASQVTGEKEKPDE